MKFSLVVSLLLIAVISFSQIPTDNLRAYYPFNGNADDESTYSHDGAVNGATLSSDRFGNEESCYEFDGVDDFIKVLHSADLNFDASTGTYSINFWFRSGNPVKTAFTAYIIQKDSSGAGGFPFHFDVSETGGLAYPQFRARGNTTTTTSGLAPVWFDGDWHMATMIITATDFHVYMDGLHSSTISISLPPSGANMADVTFGAGTDGIVPYWGGLDDIRMYADELTACEIWALYIENNLDFNDFDSVEVCPGSSYSFGDGTVYSSITTDTTHAYSIVSSLGCDSIIKTIFVSPALPYADVSMSTGLLTASPTGESYQWVDCDDGYSPIAGATDQTYAAPSGGNYAVIIDFGDCSDTSDCISTASIGLTEETYNFVVYPNPASNRISFETNAVEFSVLIINQTGKEALSGNKLKQGDKLDVSSLESGYYTLLIQSGNQVERIPLLVSE